MPASASISLDRAVVVVSASAGDVVSRPAITYHGQSAGDADVFLWGRPAQVLFEGSGTTSASYAHDYNILLDGFRLLHRQTTPPWAGDRRGHLPHCPVTRERCSPGSAAVADSGSGLRGRRHPIRVTVSVRWPRSGPKCSMSAPVASDTRSPFSARSDQSILGGRPEPGGDQDRRAR